MCCFLALTTCSIAAIQSSGVTPNLDKCSFCLHSIKFLGHIVDQNGISTDPEKTAAIIQMRSPQNIAELRRFLRMVNQLSKFSPHISKLTYPLWQVLTKKNDWMWNPMLEATFTEVKSVLISPTILTVYDTTANLLSRRLFAQPVCSSCTEKVFICPMEASHLCIPFSHWDGEKLLSNWEGDLGFYLQLQAIQWLHSWQISNRGNRPQTSGFTPRDKESQPSTSTHLKVLLSFWLHYYSCTGEKLAYSQCTVTDYSDQKF